MGSATSENVKILAVANSSVRFTLGGLLKIRNGTPDKRCDSMISGRSYLRSNN
jgi:hypothetical protein